MPHPIFKFLALVAVTLQLLSTATTVSAAMLPTRTFLTEGREGRWNDDGTKIVFTRDTIYSSKFRFNVFTADADGTNAEQITFFRGNEFINQHGTAWLPTFRPGTNDIYWRDDTNGAWYAAYAANSTPGNRTRTNIGGHFSAIRFSQDGSKYAYSYFLGPGQHRIYVGSGTATPGSSIYLTGIDQRILGEMNWGFGDYADTITFAQGIGNGPDSLYTIQSNGTNATRITDDAFGVVRDPIWSPDGESIFFKRQFNDQWDVWSLNLETNRLVQWTDDADEELNPTLSPDGSTLMFNVYDEVATASSPTSVFRLFTLDVSTIPVPEPSSVILVLLGAVGLGAVVRR